MKDSKRKKKKTTLFGLSSLIRKLPEGTSQISRSLSGNFFDKSGQSDKMNVKNYKLSKFTDFIQ